MLWTGIYIVSIVFVNWVFSIAPLLDLGIAKLPPGAFLVGFIFVIRDFVQREIGHKVIVAMLVAGGLSYFMADPYVAAASVAAFLLGEFADWAVYSFTKYPFSKRILLSSAIGIPVDSAVFLAMIGHFSVAGVVVMTVAKMVAALAVWHLIYRKERVAG